MSSSTLRTGFFLALLSVLLIMIGGALGGRGGMWVAFLIALVMNVGSYWFSDKIALAMTRAKEATESEAPQLHRIIRNLTTRAGLPMPRVYITPQEAPNAFATGRNPQHAAVAVTEGLLRSMKERELTGVLAHELAHVRNRDTLTMTVAATLAGAIMMLADMARWATFFGGYRNDDREEGGGAGVVGAILMMVLAPLAAMLIQMAISRSREYAADATGAKIAGKPDGLADALAKLDQASRMIPMETSPATAHLFIVNPLSGQGLLTLFSTHPPVEERIARLRSMRVV